jgi:N-acetylglutamate synthase-like GNAT family acetyltransferase
MKIEYLADHPEHIKSVARWLYEQWGHLSPDRDTQFRIRELLRRSKKAQVPSAFISLQDGLLTGTASLTEDDMENHPELTPWLASVYVHPEYRNKGTARALVGRVIEEASSIGIKTLYLFTFDQKEFYKKMGWTEMFDDYYKGELVTVMSYDLHFKGEI